MQLRCYCEAMFLGPVQATFSMGDPRVRMTVPLTLFFEAHHASLVGLHD